jgi:hypothetical protein
MCPGEAGESFSQVADGNLCCQYSSKSRQPQKNDPKPFGGAEMHTYYSRLEERYTLHKGAEMSTRSDAPKVFISYSWTSVAHETWVIELAERLMSDGADVILDKWELKEGQDKYTFMEQMVNDESIKRVLIICDKQYAEKADERRGGAGTESQIISAEIYNKVKQEKFVPVITEYDGHGEPFVPTYLKSRIYVDLSNSEKYLSEYEKLLRNIFDRPALKKPPIGSPPGHLFEEEPPKLLTSRKFALFSDAFNQNRPVSKSLLKEYLDSLLDTIKQETINPKEGEFVDELVISSIARLLPARDEFLEAMEFLSKNKADESYFLIVHDFFKGLLELTEADPSPRADKLDNYRFIQYEFFVSLISVLMQNQLSDILEIFLDGDYYLTTSYKRQALAYNAFNRFTETLNQQRKNRLKLNRKSVQADLLVERANHSLLNKESFIQADFVLFLRSIICPREGLRWWRPKTIIYDFIIPFEIFFKARSAINFDFLKRLFKFTSVEQFIEKINNSGHEKLLGDYYFDSFHNLGEMIDIEKLYSIYKSEKL